MIETQKSRARWEQDHKAAAAQLRATPLGGLARPAVRPVQQQEAEPQQGKSTTKTSWYQKNKEKLKALQEKDPPPSEEGPTPKSKKEYQRLARQRWYQKNKERAKQYRLDYKKKYKK